MNPIVIPPTKPTQFTTYWLGAFIWMLGWIAVYTLDGHLDVSNLAMLLVLTSALASVCFPWRMSISLAVAFVLVFDWFFIPPRGTFTVDIHQHALMLFVMLVVNIIIVSLVAVKRAQSELAERHAREADILRQWSDALLESTAPQEHLAELQYLLENLSGKKVSLLVLKNDLPEQDDIQQVSLLGETSIEQRHALWYCLRNNQQLGRGTGRFDMFSDVYLPLRARGYALGAALLSNFAEHEVSTRIHLQAICDQFGNALERYRSHQQELTAREHAQAQLVRNNLLAAISHDYRTPLATIMGAASSLNEQTEKLDAAQHHQLAQRIYDEAERLNLMTNNILQFARLDAEKRIKCDWQSAEEILADLMRRWRGRNLGHRLQIQLQPQLPLLWCDAVLIGQLLENLVDNALKYSPPDSPVSIDVHLENHLCLFSVSDKGQGIDSRWHHTIFEPFQRGPIDQHGTPTVGAGVGLALCRAIARAHGGDVSLLCPADGGSCFSLQLPLYELPADLQHGDVQ